MVYLYSNTYPSQDTQEENCFTLSNIQNSLKCTFSNKGVVRKLLFLNEFFREPWWNFIYYSLHFSHNLMKTTN